MILIISPTYQTFSVNEKPHEGHNSLLFLESIICIRKVNSVVCYLEFQGICVIRTGDKVCMDTSCTTELSLIGAMLIQPQTVSLTGTIGLTVHTTWMHKHNMLMTTNSLLNALLTCFGQMCKHYMQVQTERGGSGVHRDQNNHGQLGDDNHSLF